jgi:hypothetical protein
MDLYNFVWFVLFLFLFLALKVSLNLFSSYLYNKPLGHQSLFDSILRDHVLARQKCGSTFSVIVMISRFESVTTFLADQPIVTSFVCSVFTFAFSCYHVSLSFVYIMRFGCVYDLNFMEEQIGESIARIAVASITLCASLGIVLFLILSGDLGSGPLFTMVTDKPSIESKFFTKKTIW